MKQICISFDVFDTLIVRSVAMPHDIFSLIETYCNNHFPTCPKNFSELRIRSYYNAQNKYGKKTTLQCIYSELNQYYGEEISKFLMNLEIKYEIDGCRPNPKYVSLFKKFVAEGKQIVIISDMYLSSEVIGKMLEKCGIFGYTKIFVSCEWGGRKSDKSLFRIVLKELNLKPYQLCHIGDRIKSDFLNPLLLGIRARWAHKTEYKTSKIKKMQSDSQFQYRTFDRCIQNLCQNSLSDKYEKLGCKTFGPLLIGFNSWLTKKLKEDNITDVYFVARDGYMMKLVFDKFVNKQDIAFNSHYLYGSRRSFTVPMLWTHPELKDLLKYIAVHGKTNRYFISQIGLDLDDYIKNIAESAGMNLDAEFNEQLECTKIFYESVKDIVIENSKREYDAFLSYISTFRMKEKIALVDVGYHGTMQKALEQLLEQIGMNVKVKGYYVGIAPNANVFKNQNMQGEGYLFEYHKNEEFYRYIWGSFVPIIESVYFPREGSVKRFILENGKCDIEFYDFEFSNPKGAKIDETHIMDGYQNGALQFVDDISKSFPYFEENINPEVALFNFSKMCRKPTLQETRLWGDFRMFDFSISYIARPRKFFKYLINYRLLKQDFINSHWKIGFMRRLFKLPLPYDKIYNHLKDRFC